MEKKETNLVEETLKLYEVPAKWVLASRVDRNTGEVIFVTHGGKKIRHKIGEAATRTLTEVEITGFLPKRELMWSTQLNQGIDPKTLIKIKK